MAIRRVRIFPTIGVARLGNSKTQYYVGPEIPDFSQPPSGGYRDSDPGRLIKRQGARFHLFGYDENDKLVGEISSDDADISWTVHIANTKAASEWFHSKSEPSPAMRNAKFAGERNQLKLDPGEVNIGGKNADFADLTKSLSVNRAKDIEINQLFLDKPVKVKLGTVTTDDKGLLIVLGGHGESKSPVGATLAGGNFANHDGWYDDVSDGVVKATVSLRDGSTPPVTDAWVLIAPPKYAPELKTIVSLYDTLRQSAVDKNILASLFADPTFKPSFTTDIYPILLRAANMRWVYSNGQPQFSLGEFHRTFNDISAANRATVFARLSTPATVPGEPAVGGGDMPRMWSDAYPQGANGTLTRIQYQTIKMWKDGNFVNDWNGGPAPPAATVTPDGLIRAALEPCVGAAFYPGIEASWKLRDDYAFSEAFRLDSSTMDPGDITKQMSLPWQSDFLDCAVESSQSGLDLVWWPAQRPINVLSTMTGDNYIPWARSTASGTDEMTVEQMITDWYKLGFILKRSNGRYEEDDRI